MKYSIQFNIFWIVWNVSLVIFGILFLPIDIEKKEYFQVLVDGLMIGIGVYCGAKDVNSLVDNWSKKNG